MIATIISRNLSVFSILVAFYCSIYEARLSRDGLARMWNQNGGGFDFRQEKFAYKPHHESFKVKGTDINGVASKIAKENGKID